MNYTKLIGEYERLEEEKFLERLNDMYIEEMREIGVEVLI